MPDSPYTVTESEAFEAIVDALRAHPSAINAALWQMNDDVRLKKAGMHLDLHALGALLRGQKWAAWYEDYEAVHSVATEVEAFDHLPAAQARLLAEEHRKRVFDARRTMEKRLARQQEQAGMPPPERAVTAEDDDEPLFES